MTKHLSVLVAALFAAGAFAATSSPSSLSGSGSTSGSLSGSASNATSANANTNNNTSLNANSNTNTNRNTVNVYGPGSNKLARQQASGTQPTGGTQTASGDRMQRPSGDRTASTTRPSGERHASASTGWCPPGLAKKDNGCMPPGQAKKLESSTSVMGNRGSTPEEREHHSLHRSGSGSKHHVARRER